MPQQTSNARSPDMYSTVPCGVVSKVRLFQLYTVPRHFVDNTPGKAVAECTNAATKTLGIKCGNGTCLPFTKYRDCVVDCDDGIDERTLKSPYPDVLLLIKNAPMVLSNAPTVAHAFVQVELPLTAPARQAARRRQSGAL